MTPLLDDLRDLGAKLNPSDKPGESETTGVVAGIIKVLEHAGVTVAETLFPEADAAVAVAAPAVEAAASKAVADLNAKFDALLAKLGADTAPVPPAAPAPVAPAPAASPPAPPLPPVPPVAPPVEAIPPPAPDPAAAVAALLGVEDTAGASVDPASS